MLTPMDIHNHEFKKSFRGYNENEVDDFLDRIVNDYERVLRENEKLKDKLHLSEQELSHYRNLEQNFQNTLMVAQKTAEEYISSAKKTAQETRDTATRETESIRENTAREAKNIREQAQLDAKRHLDEAAHKLHNAAVEYDTIIREKSSFLVKMRTALESELAIVVQLLNTVPGPEVSAAMKASAEKLEQALKIANEVPKNEPTPVPAEKVEPVAKPAEKTSRSESPAKPVDQLPKVSAAKPAAQNPKPPSPAQPAPQKNKTNAPSLLASDKNENENEDEDELDNTLNYAPVKKSSN